MAAAQTMLATVSSQSRREVLEILRSVLGRQCSAVSTWRVYQGFSSERGCLFWNFTYFETRLGLVGG